MKTLRGYVTVKKFGGYAMPVPIQNKLLRSYCKDHNFVYLLPQCEMIKENNFCYLFSTLNQMKKNEHLGMCSAHMLPKDKAKFNEVREIIIDKNLECHFIFENLSISSTELKDLYIQINLHTHLGIRSKEAFKDIFNF